MAKYYCTGWKFASNDINNCCHQHDRDYGINGKVTRVEADNRLRNCILKNGHPIKAWLFWVIVRLFGWIFWKKDKVTPFKN